MSFSAKRPASRLPVRCALPPGPVLFLAGVSFLIYEVSWNRILSLVLGTTITASTIVLATFMAGFGTGAFVWGRIANRRGGVHKLLALLLALAGLLSAMDYFLFTRTTPWFYSFLNNHGLSPGAGDRLVFACAAIFLFAPAFVMSGVFPLGCKLALRRGGDVGSSLGRLYALETFGSTVGALAAGFFLLGTFGQRDTLFLAVLINLILAGAL